jgi:hypothetical protein
MLGEKPHEKKEKEKKNKQTPRRRIPPLDSLLR